jgi:outer membrane protein assembly factor BamB
MQKRLAAMRWAVGTAAALSVACTCAVPAAEATKTAGDIVSASGVEGGLVVHLGCGDGTLTAALRADERYLVHGLGTDRESVDAARTTIRKLGLYGPVSVDLLSGERLPYTDNLVNLVVMSSGECPVAREEIVRVLAPRGVAIVRARLKPPLAGLSPLATRHSTLSEDWLAFRKPVPSDIDDWTHYLHSANNNAVAADSVVGPPAHYQWVSEPRWTRSHDHLNSLSALVSAQGRIYYIFDEAPTLSVALPAVWRLVARDAFNGVLLWKRPITSWEGHLRGFRTGPSELARRLVAVGDRVYVTLGYGEPVSVLDGATGKTIRTYGGTVKALEFVVSDGKLFAVIGDRLPDNTDGAIQPVRPGKLWMHWPIFHEKPPRKRVVAIAVDTGKELWTLDTPGLMPTALAVDGGRVYLQNTGHVIALDASSGKEAWRAARKVNQRRPSWSGTTLVVQDGIVLSGDRAVDAVHPGTNAESDTPQWVVNSHGGVAPQGEIVAFDAATGERLWQAPCKEVYNAPVDVLVVGGRVWSGALVHKREAGITQGLDLKTGAVAMTRPKDQQFFNIVMGHHRCYRNKATTDYLVLGRDGIELIDVKSGKGYGHGWVRGSCQYGVMPANGLVYAPPHSCACHVESKLNSFNALAAKREPPQDGASDGARLERGPSYAKASEGNSEIRNPQSDWPTYRGDTARSGVAATRVRASIKQAWRAAPGGQLSSVVAGEGMCLVASKDRHGVHAFSMADGRQLWEYTVGGSVDSPPTLHGGNALFGCTDGWIYSVHLSDGRLNWRFRAAPLERRIVAYGRVESPWPVHGSVLVQDGVLYAVAGRSAHVDGGMKLCRLNAETGDLLSETPIEKGALPDVPTFYRGSVFIRHRRFSPQGEAQPANMPHLYSPAGFLDGTWWHRTYWQYGTGMRSAYGGWPISATQRPAGRLLVMDDKTLYGFGRFNQYNRIGGHVGLGQMSYKLYAARKAVPRAAGGKKKGAKLPPANRVPALWERDLPLLARGMVLAGETLFVAGPPSRFKPSEPVQGNPYLPGPPEALQAQVDTLAGKGGGLLWAVSAIDGKRLAELKLDAVPVWDGMAAADGCLLLALQDGSVCCFR